MTKTRLLAGTAKVIECGSNDNGIRIMTPYAIIECNGEKVKYNSDNASTLRDGQELDTFMAFVTKDNTIRHPFIQWNERKGRRQIGNQPKNKDLVEMYFKSVGL